MHDERRYSYAMFQIDRTFLTTVLNKSFSGKLPFYQRDYIRLAIMDIVVFVQ